MEMSTLDAEARERLPAVRVSVNVQADHLHRLAKVKPLAGLAEVIWNALDAEATDISISVAQTPLGAVDSVTIDDNGHGIAPDEAADVFGKLGGSWKTRGGPTRNRTRVLHGNDGQGRFRAFGVGSAARWDTTAADPQGLLRRSVINGSSSTISDFDIVTDPTVASGPTGTTVTIVNCRPECAELLTPRAHQSLVMTFALYLQNYPSVTISFRGKKLDPAEAQVAKTDLDMGEPIPGRGTAKVTVIEWATEFPRGLLLCDESGIVLHEMPVGIHAPGFDFTAYLRWDGHRDLQEELGLAEMSPTLSPIIDHARVLMREHFRARTKEKTRQLVDRWKSEDVYPYRSKPTTQVEQAERDLFDVVALTIASAAPNVAAGADKVSTKLQFELLKLAIEENPTSAHRIIQKVIDLPPDRRDELAELLERSPLTTVISAARLITDRLAFLDEFERLIFSTDTKPVVKERAHIHEILAKETWVFGDRYHLAASDRGLREVLRQHIGLLGRTELVDTPVLGTDGKQKRVDLMLSMAMKAPAAKAREHLVIELKRPSQILDRDEQIQISDYANAVMADERFASVDAQWEFWLIGNSMSDAVHRAAHQANRPAGLLEDGDGYRIWVRTWAQILEDCRARLQFVRDIIETEPNDDDFAYLRRTHAAHLPPELFADADADEAAAS